MADTLEPTPFEWASTHALEERIVANELKLVIAPIAFHFCCFHRGTEDPFVVPNQVFPSSGIPHGIMGINNLVVIDNGMITGDDNFIIGDGNVVMGLNNIAVGNDTLFVKPKVDDERLLAEGAGNRQYKLPITIFHTTKNNFFEYTNLDHLFQTIQMLDSWDVNTNIYGTSELFDAIDRFVAQETPPSNSRSQYYRRMNLRTLREHPYGRYTPTNPHAKAETMYKKLLFTWIVNKYLKRVLELRSGLHFNWTQDVLDRIGADYVRFYMDHLIRLHLGALDRVAGPGRDAGGGGFVIRMFQGSGDSDEDEEETQHLFNVDDFNWDEESEEQERLNQKPTESMLPAPGEDGPAEGNTPACVICATNACTIMVNPCGHMCLCGVCAVNPNLNRKCMICRKPYENLKRVFTVGFAQMKNDDDDDEKKEKSNSVPPPL